MILKKDMLTKAMSKGRIEAEQLLRRIAAVGGRSPPQYDYETSGFSNRKSHYCHVRFIVPQSLRDDYVLKYGFDMIPPKIVGSGRCSTKKDAKSLASLEVIQRLQTESCLSLDELKKQIHEWEAKYKLKRVEVETTSIDKEITGVSWSSIPNDPSFIGQDRSGHIRFSPRLVNDPKAFAAARSLTLRCQDNLPKVIHHNHQNDTMYGENQLFANIKPFSGKKSKAIVGSPKGEHEKKLVQTEEDAEILVLHKAYKKNSIGKDILRGEKRNNITSPTSMGMAKLLARWPAHQVDDLKELLDQVVDVVENEQIDNNKSNQTIQKVNVRRKVPKKKPMMVEDENLLKSRLQALRRHQKQIPLPVDSIRDSIQNNDAAVTIVQGGTGSGKTTRYPLMLSLFSPSGPNTKVLVAQPRRLACQAAAQRVAYEQDVTLGSNNCPIGYSIRFKSIPSSAQQRTVDFQTPGVILRRAMQDPTMSDVTHLVLDEVHERNADIDLLLALAKEAQQQREDSDNPLRIILMSATLDAQMWKQYFQSADCDNNEVSIVDVPSERRFPIDIVHLGDEQFPGENMKSIKQLEMSSKDSYDDLLCSAAADLATTLITNEEVVNGGSILVFLAGLDQIRAVDKIIGEKTSHSGMQKPTVRYLHSSLSSGEQQKVFTPGTKIILSTNIAETSITIPDVKFVIDTGQEKQFSMLDDSGNEDWMSAVGSQLTTVNISQASAQQRSGRAGRVSAGTCYRLYSKQAFDNEFAAYTKPEMLRVDLSQMILHSLSMYHPTFGKPTDLLLRTPDPPAPAKVQQTLRSLRELGLVEEETIADKEMSDRDMGVFEEEKGLAKKKTNNGNASLTPLGQAVSSLPVSPHIGRMLYMGLVLCAADPALQIAALLSVPSVFQRERQVRGQHTSDVVQVLETYQKYLKQGRSHKKGNATVDKAFEQVSRIESQLKRALMDGMKRQGRGDIEWSKWNTNTNRLAAVAALVCNATPHIAHMIGDKNDFATRDVAGGAKIHPGSCNFRPERRTQWYLYNELRRTSAPYLHVTTAVSPLEVALFAVTTSLDEKEYERYKSKKDKWLLLADQWVPVSTVGDGRSFAKLRKLISHDLLQTVAQDPGRHNINPIYNRIVLFALSAIEQQRIQKK